MAINYLNCTPHAINIYSKEDTVFDAEVRKLLVKDGAQPIKIIPPSGRLLNCQKETSLLPRWVSDQEFDPFLVGAVQFIAADVVPCEEYPETIFIVSNLYRAARIQLGMATRYLATVNDIVYSDVSEPKPIGCLGLAVG